MLHLHFIFLSFFSSLWSTVRFNPVIFRLFILHDCPVWPFFSSSQIVRQFNKLATYTGHKLKVCQSTCNSTLAFSLFFSLSLSLHCSFTPFASSTLSLSLANDHHSTAATFVSFTLCTLCTGDNCNSLTGIEQILTWEASFLGCDILRT